KILLLFLSFQDMGEKCNFLYYFVEKSRRWWGTGGYGYRVHSSLKISMSKNFCNYLCLLFLMITSGDLFYSRPAQFKLLLQGLSFFIGPFELFHRSVKALLLTSK
ncbi:hypothetical protein Csa_023531, partial [Cucumis sativus]